jgi:hypothetical protein
MPLAKEEHEALKRKVAGWAMLAAFSQGRFGEAKAASEWLRRRK